MFILWFCDVILMLVLGVWYDILYPMSSLKGYKIKKSKDGQ
jgi:hypothetical protein